MITELSVENFTKIVVNKLNEKTNDVLLSNPQITSIFPCCIVSLPLSSIEITEDGVPVRSRFSISIEWWTDKKYSSMQLLDETDILLRTLGMTRVNTNIDMFDDITKKYRYGGQYEVFYNGLTNAFERII